MTSTREHKKKIEEHLSEIEDAIDMGIENRPITIGFHCSSCAVQLLELYLHETKRISMGKVIKHDWFKRPKQEQKKPPLIERKLPVEFPRKKQIYELIYEIEGDRTSLLYGKPAEEQVEKVLDAFQKLKSIFVEELKKEGIHIE